MATENPVSEIAVLYRGLVRKCVPWGRRETLKRDDVLAVELSGGHDRRQALIGHDWYYLVWTEADCCLVPYDGTDTFFSLTEPNRLSTRFPFVLPDNCIVFEGVYVGSEEYEEAKRIFDGGLA